MSLLQQLTDTEFLARVLPAEQGLSAIIQSVAAVVIAAFVTDVRSTALWASTATGSLLIAVALVVKLRRSPTGVDEVGDDMDLDLETAGAEVFLPD